LLPIFGFSHKKMRETQNNIVLSDTLLPLPLGRATWEEKLFVFFFYFFLPRSLSLYAPHLPKHCKTQNPTQPTPPYDENT
jgi:hypothetical protein